MSLAITHFALGAGAMVLLLAAFAPSFRHRTTAVVGSGLWALGPDILYLLPGEGVLAGLRFSAVWNVFWFHHYLDGADPGDSPAFAAGLVVLLVVVLAFCELLTRTGTAPTAASPVESGHE